MQTDYWKSQEVQPTFKEWQSFMEGCVMCQCDHGCNQWMLEQRSKIALFMRILSTKGNTSLDKLAQMPLQRANRIYFLLSIREAVKFNKELRDEQNKEGQ